jgi:hypothetical protein
MARKPNYQFERRERERLKAEKKRAKKEARAAAKEAAKGPEGAGPDSVQEPDQTVTPES